MHRRSERAARRRRDQRADLDATAQLTVDLIDQAVALLQTQNADTIGDSFVHCAPHTSYDIRKDP